MSKHSKVAYRYFHSYNQETGKMLASLTLCIIPVAAEGPIATLDYPITKPAAKWHVGMALKHKADQYDKSYAKSCAYERALYVANGCTGAGQIQVGMGRLAAASKKCNQI